MTEMTAPGLDLHRYASMVKDKDAGEFEEALLERFADSEEARPILEREGAVGWAGMFMQVARQYEGYYLPLMGPGEVRLVLLRTFPRKVSCKPSSAREIMEELRAFYAFLGRELAFPRAAGFVALLSDELLQEMESALANPANFGVAKSFFMGGSAAAAAPRSTALGRASSPLLAGTGAPWRAPLSKADRNRKKAQRRAERDARRKGR